MATKSNYLVNGNSVEELINVLNLHMQDIADRLDKLEGVRGRQNLDAESITTDGSVTIYDEDDTLIHSFK